MTIVSNSSPLIALAQIGRLLEKIHPQIFIPPAVAKEIEPTIPMLPGWVSIKPVAQPLGRDVLTAAIWPGETEVLSLGLELRAAQLLLDERPARRFAKQLGVPVIGTVGLLLLAKRRGLLREVRPELDRLLSARFFMNQEFYDLVLAEAGE